MATCLHCAQPELLDGMLEAYTRAGVTVKKAIHKQAPNVVRGIGMSHPYVRHMVQTFPKGAETFVLQALHLLTDQATPTPELTEAVKEAHAHRIHDARFLIPVLAGLNKDDTIASLPRLINLPPTIVKNVIHRLLHNKVRGPHHTRMSTTATMMGLRV
jgi:symplekin